jgi:hypothetical protein
MPKREYTKRTVIPNGSTFFAFALMGICLNRMPFYTMDQRLKDRGPFLNNLSSTYFNDDLLGRFLTNVNKIGPTEFVISVVNHLRTKLSDEYGQVSELRMSEKDFFSWLIRFQMTNNDPLFSVDEKIGDTTLVDDKYYKLFEKSLLDGILKSSKILMLSDHLYSVLNLERLGAEWIARVPDYLPEAMAAKISSDKSLIPLNIQPFKYGASVSPFKFQKWIIVDTGSASAAFEEKKVEAKAAKNFRNLTRTAYLTEKDAERARDAFLKSHPLFIIHGFSTKLKSKRPEGQKKTKGRPIIGSDMDRSFLIKGKLQRAPGAFANQNRLILATNVFDCDPENIVNQYLSSFDNGKVKPSEFDYLPNKSLKLSYFAKNPSREECEKAISSLTFFFHAFMEFEASLRKGTAQNKAPGGQNKDPDGQS